MLIALLADIHGNLPALEAALSDIRKKHRPDRIVSLGDQVNLGPCPRETMALLRESGVDCLHGNHERYVLAAMADDPAYAGANFASLRFNAGQLTAKEITLPRTLRVGHVLLTHAMPEDDRFPVNDPALALPRIREMRFDEPAHIVCGHGHNPTHYRIGNLTLDGIGSLGCMDDGVPGVASYTLLRVERDGAVLQPCFFSYDARALKPLFVKSGFAEACPIMAHIICRQMTDNHDYLVSFVTLAREISAQKGEKTVSPESWQEADARYPWPGGEQTAAFWKPQM